MQDYFDSYDTDDEEQGGMPASIFSLTPPDFDEVTPPTEAELKVQEEEFAKRVEEEERLAKEKAQEEVEKEQFQNEPEEDEGEAFSIVSVGKEAREQKTDPFDKVDFEDDCAIKKYIFAVSRDFSDTIDVLDLDARSAFINDAISLKIEKDQQNAKKEHALNIIRHVATVVFTIIIGVPLVFVLVNMSIDSTLHSYEYVQKNFEQLYKEKADRDALLKSSRTMVKEKGLTH